MSDDTIKRVDVEKALNEWVGSSTANIFQLIDKIPSADRPSEIIYGNEHNCIMTIFGECSYAETGCGDCAVVDKVRKVLSVDRSQGEWIRDGYWSRGAGMGEAYGFFYKCSLCEYEVEGGYTRCGFNFCPYCGADMRKGTNR